MKGRRKIVMLTAYDFTFAKLLDGLVDIILVGDSLGMVVLGYKGTNKVTMNDMIRAVGAVARGAYQTHITADMPINSYNNNKDALTNAKRLLAAGAHSVKIENRPDIAEFLVANGVAVMGHIGLTPQTITTFKVQGRSPESAKRLLEEAEKLEKAGCFALVLECIPEMLADKITKAIAIPTIGIGAGRACDGQVLVTYDMLGLFEEFKPKFVKRYLEAGRLVRQAVASFAAEVRQGRFPQKKHTYHLPKSHPRYQSLYYRDLLAEGVKEGITSVQGLIAHGRGEAFDYLLGEKTHTFAKKATKAAAAMLVLARCPVISVNGNTAVLVARELVKLSQVVPAKLEVNLFHGSRKREQKIASLLKRYGAKEVLLPDKGKIPGIESNRHLVAMEGQEKADVVFVPLEDGDRTQALVAMGKKVITVDLNPLSRTAQTATVTIVDNIVRVMPLLIKYVKELSSKKRKDLRGLLSDYKNNKIVEEAENILRGKFHMIKSL